MLQVIFFLVAIIGLIFSKSRMMRIILIGYIGVVIALNSYNPDYSSYMLIYQNPSAAQEEIGFRFLCGIANRIKLSYDQFHFIIVVLGLMLLIKGTNWLFKMENVRATNYYLVSYMFYPMMMDVVLLRSFLSTCMILYGFHFLLQKRRGHYVTTILVASTIHVSSLFFLLFLLEDKIHPIVLTSNMITGDRKTNKKKHRRIILISFTIIVTLLVVLRFEILQNLMTMMGFNALKVDIMLDGSNINAKMIIYGIIIGMINFVPFMLNRRMSARDIDCIGNYDHLMFTVNLVLLINIVLVIYSDQFLRLLGVGVMLNSIYYAVLMKMEHRQSRRWFIMLTGLIAPVFLFWYRMFVYETANGIPYIDYVFQCVLENNFFINFFK